MDLKEIRTDSRPLYDGRILKLREDTVRLPNGGTAFREIIEHNGGSCVVAVTDDGRILLVRQHRYAVDTLEPELPAGKRDKDEDPARCAARELEEETGYRAETLTLLTRLHPTPAYCQELIYVYQAEGLHPVGQHLDEDEFLQVEAIPFSDALAMVKNGEITDAKTQIGILLYALQNHIQ